MFRPVLVLFICSVVFNQFNVIQPAGTEDTLEKCGPNEVLNDCVGCPPEDFCYDRILCPRVIESCSPSCICKEGFIRKTLEGECIPKEECGAPCEIFEEYTVCKQCANETCSSITNPVKQNCNDREDCTPGCTCLDGYYRADVNSYCQYRCSCPELEDTPHCVWWRAPLAEFFPKQKTQH